MDVLLEMESNKDLERTKKKRKGRPVRKVEMMGVVASRERKDKFLKFQVDDGTVCVLCILWLNHLTARYYSRVQKPQLQCIAVMTLEQAEEVQLSRLVKLQGRVTSYNRQLQVCYFYGFLKLNGYFSLFLKLDRLIKCQLLMLPNLNWFAISIQVRRQNISCLVSWKNDYLNSLQGKRSKNLSRDLGAQQGHTRSKTHIRILGRAIIRKGRILNRQLTVKFLLDEIDPNAEIHHWMDCICLVVRCYDLPASFPPKDNAL
ncbi:uncharacterized protein LOC131052887 [Cryptomeria japonica]|uniref:uncharacterized protein LOC131052887 n=1 Tax=Cryptomeria japonica TaxID=3369 RepID=UPI0027DA96F4|nr:uncharacterized protein LOC131052887 [Cryptomeria japonica]